MRLALAALACTLAVPSVARANGRFPTSTNVTFKTGSTEDIYLAVTFGLLHSPDDGVHWYWMCEDSIGYGGAFDPKYKIDADGTIYATTYGGLRVSRDGGCTFDLATAPPAGGGELVDFWVDAIDIGSDGVVWLATAETGQANGVWTTTDRGATVTPMGLSSKTAWWKSLEVAPTDADRIYVTGYQLQPTASVLIYRSVDHGQSWEPLPTDALLLGDEPLVLLEGVDPADPDIVYLRSVDANDPGDRLYRSDDGGQSWTAVLDTQDTLRGFAIRADGDIVTGTVGDKMNPESCVYRSSDRGVSFTKCERGPQMACVGERSDGELFSCGANWDPDYFALGRSGDRDDWSKVFRFHEMAGPVACPEGTIQHDTCELVQWPGIREQYGVTGPVDGGGGDGGAMGDDEGTAKNGGCCDAGGGAAGSSALLGLALAGLWRRRRGYGSGPSSRTSASRQLG